MKRLTLGRTGLHVTDLCFGTLNFGWTVNETQAFALLDHYHAAGGNFLHASAFSTRMNQGAERPRSTSRIPSAPMPK